MIKPCWYWSGVNQALNERLAGKVRGDGVQLRKCKGLVLGVIVRCSLLPLPPRILDRGAVYVRIYQVIVALIRRLFRLVSRWCGKWYVWL